MTDAWFWYEQISAAPGPELDAADVASAFGPATVAFLGRGSFGETWRVGDTAVKILAATYPVARLQREVDGLLSAACPSVVRLLQADARPVAGTTRPYLVFEFVDGGDASSHLARGNGPDEAGAVAFATGVFEALAALHGASAMHRDVKPENIALRSGRWQDPVLLDFGLTRFADSTTLTMYPGMVGTPAFMAPEQIRGERARKGSDVWAAGAVVYTALTGRHPFYGSRADAVDRDGALALIAAGPRPLPEGCDSALASLIRSWLAPEIHARGSARRALAGLAQIQGGS